MNFMHIPIIAVIQIVITYLWNRFFRNRRFQSKEIWMLTALGSVFNVWGLDALQRDLGIDRLYTMVILSFGVWICFTLVTNLKYLLMYKWSKRDFWMDSLGEALCFVFSGILIFVMT